MLVTLSLVVNCSSKLCNDRLRLREVSDLRLEIESLMNTIDLSDKHLQLLISSASVLSGLRLANILHTRATLLSVTFYLVVPFYYRLRESCVRYLRVEIDSVTTLIDLSESQFHLPIFKFN
jgi:hypothetical protein